METEVCDNVKFIMTQTFSYINGSWSQIFNSQHEDFTALGIATQPHWCEVSCCVDL